MSLLYECINTVIAGKNFQPHRIVRCATDGDLSEKSSSPGERCTDSDKKNSGFLEKACDLFVLNKTRDESP